MLIFHWFREGNGVKRVFLLVFCGQNGGSQGTNNKDRPGRVMPFRGNSDSFKKVLIFHWFYVYNAERPVWSRPTIIIF